MTRWILVLPLLVGSLVYGQSTSSRNNNGFSGAPYRVGVTVTATTTLPAAEEMIAIDPSNSSNLVGVITDFSVRGPNEGTTKYVVSNNKGASWTESFVPLSSTFPITSDGVTWEENRDPAVAIDKAQNVYIAGIYELLSGGQTQNPASGVYVCHGTLPNVTLTALGCHPVFTVTSQGNDPFSEDKVSIAVDNSNSAFSGNVYVTWVHFTGCSGAFHCTQKAITFSRSSDHGISWSAPLQLSVSNTNVQWPQIIVGSEGTIYVAYETIMGSNIGQHRLAISSNGGVTFTSAQTITPIYQELTFTSSYRKNSGPNIIVSPVPGAEFVYDVYAAQNGRTSNIVFARSALPKGLGGFTSPVPLSDSTIGQRLFPAGAIDTNGILHVSWFDTRNSRTVSMYDIYATYSKNLGATFAPNARVTSKSINTLNAAFIGDFSGITAEPSSGVAHPVWSNNRLQTTTLTVP